MTVAADITQLLSADQEQVNKGSAFYTAVYLYGMGVIQIMDDWAYQAGDAAIVQIETDLSAGGSAQVYSEGDGMPAPIETTTRNAKFAFKAIRGVIRESGHERRMRGQGDLGLVVKDPQRKIKRATAAMKDLIAKTFDDSAAYGLEGQISASTNFGDQVRTTYTALKAYSLAAASSNPTTALLNKFVQLGHDTPYGVAADIAIGPATQAHKMGELGSGKLAIGSASEAGELVVTNLSVGTAPLYILPNVSTSKIFLLTGATMRPKELSTDMVSGSEKTWGVVWNEPNPGRFHVLDLGANNADIPVNIQLSTSLAMVHTNPNQQAVLTGLSTG